MITILHHIRNERGETQTIGFTRFDNEPTRDEMIRIRDKLCAENRHATEIILTRKAGDNSVFNEPGSHKSTQDPTLDIPAE